MTMTMTKTATPASVLQEMVDAMDRGDEPGAGSDWYETAVSALAATPPTAVEPVTVPDGWKLVPVEPTEAMIDAGDEINEAGAAWSGYSEIPASAEKHYRAMLAAAPTPPASTDQPEDFTADVWQRHKDLIEEAGKLREENARLQASLTDEVTVRLNAEARAATLSAENERLREALTEIASSWAARGYSDAMDAVQAMKEAATEALNAER